MQQTKHSHSHPIASISITHGLRLVELATYITANLTLALLLAYFAGSVGGDPNSLLLIAATCFCFGSSSAFMFSFVSSPLKRVSIGLITALSSMIAFYALMFTPTSLLFLVPISTSTLGYLAGAEWEKQKVLVGAVENSLLLVVVLGLSVLLGYLFISHQQNVFRFAGFLGLLSLLSQWKILTASQLRLSGKLWYLILTAVAGLYWNFSTELIHLVRDFTLPF